MLALGIFAALGLGGLSQLRIETATDSILERDSEAWRFYQHAQDLFGEDETITVGIAAKTPFEPALFARAAELTNRLKRLEGVRRVDSVSTIPMIRSAEDDSVALDPLVSPEGRLRVPAERLEGAVLADRILPGWVVSLDGQFTAINVVLEDGQAPRYPQLVDAVRGLVGEDRAWVSGVPVFRVETDSRSRRELATYLPMAAVLMMGLVWLAFRTATAVFASIFPGLVGVCVALGAMGYAGRPLSVTSVVLPPVLMGLSAAYMMHLLVAAYRGRGAETTARLQPVLRPVAISTVTTAIGFLCVGIVSVDSVRTTGIVGAVGTISVGLSCLLGGPAALSLARLDRSQVGGSERSERNARRLARLVDAHSGRIRVAAVAAGIVTVAGIARLEIGTDVTRWFPAESDVRESWDRIGAELAGLTPMNVVVKARADRAVTEPEVLSAIGRLARALEEHPEVGRSLAVTDALRQLHREFQGVEKGRLPETKAKAEQYLLILESVEQLSDLITADRHAANIMIRADNNGSAAIRDVAAFVDSWWQAQGVPGVEVRTTGTMFEFARAEDAIAFGQLKGFAYAVLGVCLVLVVCFRSVRNVLSALLANFAPIALAFGVVGLFGVRLDAGMVLVGSIAIGIAVDDTIHVVAAHDSERRTNESARDAMERAFGRVAEPIFLTTAAVSLAFGLLGLSEFTFMRNLGLLTAGVMVLCLLTDVFLLPTLITRPRSARLGEQGEPGTRKADGRAA